MYTKIIIPMEKDELKQKIKDGKVSFPINISCFGCGGIIIALAIAINFGKVLDLIGTIIKK